MQRVYSINSTWMDVAGEFHKLGIDKPEVLPTDASLMQRIHNRMLRAQIDKLNGRDFKADETEPHSIVARRIAD